MLRRQDVQLAKIFDEQLGSTLWCTGSSVAVEHRCRSAQAHCKCIDVVAGGAYPIAPQCQKAHDLRYRRGRVIPLDKPVLEAADMWLQPIDPNIDAAAMSVLSLCHAIFLDLIVGAGEVRRVEQIGGFKSIPALGERHSRSLNSPRANKAKVGMLSAPGRWRPGRREG